jgi:hypothetical protein
MNKVILSHGPIYTTEYLASSAYAMELSYKHLLLLLLLLKTRSISDERPICRLGI